MRSRIRMPGLLLLLFAVGAPFPVAGRQLAPAVEGYVRLIATSAPGFLEQRRFLTSLLRKRTTVYLDLRSDVLLKASLDTEILNGAFLETTEYAVQTRLRAEGWQRSGWDLYRADRVHLRQRLFRSTVTIRRGAVQIAAGRQRIAWGTGFVWNPTDLLNPVSPAAIERQERDGVLAGHIELAAGAFSRVEAVYAPAERFASGSTAVRLSSKIGSYDLALLAGAFRVRSVVLAPEILLAPESWDPEYAYSRTWVVGGEFAGYLGAAGLRGEWSVSRPEAGPGYARFVVNADFNFPGNLYALAEMYYNGRGATDPADYDPALLLSGDPGGLARFYGAVVLNRPLTALLSADGYVVANFTDGSALLGPGLRYSAGQNLDIAATAYLFAGDDASEFGRTSAVFFLIGSYYF